jgi:hypothetical protein
LGKHQGNRLHVVSSLPVSCCNLLVPLLLLQMLVPLLLLLPPGIYLATGDADGMVAVWMVDKAAQVACNGEGGSMIMCLQLCLLRDSPGGSPGVCLRHSSELFLGVLCAAAKPHNK